MLLPLGGNRRKDRERDLSAVWHAVTPCPSLCTYRAVQLRLLLGIKLCFLKEVHIHPLRNTTYILLLMIHLGIHKTALGKAVLNTCSAVDFTGEKRGKDHQKLIWLSGNCLGHLYQTYRGSQLYSFNDSHFILLLIQIVKYEDNKFFVAFVISQLNILLNPYILYLSIFC